MGGEKLMQNLIGFLLPPFIDLINKDIPNSKVKFVISLVVCVIVGVILNYQQLSNTQNLLGGIAIVFTTAQVTYYTYWQNSQLRQNTTLK